MNVIKFIYSQKANEMEYHNNYDNYENYYDTILNSNNCLWKLNQKAYIQCL